MQETKAYSSLGKGFWFKGYMSYRWFTRPHWVARSGSAYDVDTRHRHRDALARIHYGYQDDRYISPTDGKLKTLVVQCDDDILNRPGKGTWKQTYIRNISPLMHRVAAWPLSHISLRHSTPQSGEEWLWTILKWIPTTAILIVGVSSHFPTIKAH